MIDCVYDATGRRTGTVLNGQLVKGLAPRRRAAPDRATESSGQVEATYVYGSLANVPDLIVENNGSSPVTYRVVADHLGTPRLVVRVSDGVLVHRLDVDEFGRLVNESGRGRTCIPSGLRRVCGTGIRGSCASERGIAIAGRWTARDPVLFDGDGPATGLTALESGVT